MTTDEEITTTVQGSTTKQLLADLGQYEAAVQHNTAGPTLEQWRDATVAELVHRYGEHAPEQRTSQQFYQAAATLGRYPERVSDLQWNALTIEEDAWQAIEGNLHAVVRRLHATRYRWMVGDVAGYTWDSGAEATWSQAAARAGYTLARLNVAVGA